MSKQSTAKEIQGWRNKGPNCGNCNSFSCIKSESKTPYGNYIKFNNLRCTKGNFKTGKACWCMDHVWKEVIP